MPPSGDTNEVIQAYFRWLWEQYFTRFIDAPRVGIDWTGPALIFGAGIALLGFFFLYSFLFRHAHRTKGEIYGVSSFAGNLLERMGVLPVFSMIVYLTIFLWALSYVIRHILFGQVY